MGGDSEAGTATVKISRSKQKDAERAGEHYVRVVYGCTHTHRAVRTKFQHQDIFASDVVGKRPGGTMVFAQVTTGGYEAVRRRRKKLEAIPWQASDTVILLQLVQCQDPKNLRKKLWLFREYRFVAGVGGRYWDTCPEDLPIPGEWFRAFKDG